MAEVTPRPFAQMTTLKVGGTPTRLIEAFSRDEIVEAVRDAWRRGEDWMVLGGGSNLFVGDDDPDITVIRLRNEGIAVVGSPAPGIARVEVEAGHEWDAFVAWTVEAGLSGVEGMSGIPGTVGAAPVQNVGAYGQEVRDTLVSVELFDADSGEVSTVSAADLGLGFRTSVLKSHYGSVAERNGVILAATFDFDVVGTGPVIVRGEQLRSALRLDESAHITLDEIRNTVIATRASKGMVIDENDPDTNSAGSFFQNAVVPESFARTLPAECPRWLMAYSTERKATIVGLDEYDGQVPALGTDPEREFKISAAWLIEHTGISRGFAFAGSGAGLSTKHALALTNRGEATAAELAELARFIRGRVSAEYGLLLEPEPVLIGVEI